MNILHIDASATAGDASHSRRLSSALVRRLRETNPGATVVYRDVAAEQLPHVDTTIRQAWTPEGQGDPLLEGIAARSKTLVEELKTAGTVVIGSPMYNFTVPSTLKAWIDHVAIARQTFRYTEKGPEGLLFGQVYLALSSGGVYSQGPAASADHLSTYLKTVLNFMGLDVVGIVRAEGTALGPDKSEAAMTEALARIRALPGAV